MGHAIDLHGSGQDPGPRGWDGIVAGMDGLFRARAGAATICLSDAESLRGLLGDPWRIRAGAMQVIATGVYGCTRG